MKITRHSIQALNTTHNTMKTTRHFIHVLNTTHFKMTIPLKKDHPKYGTLVKMVTLKIAEGWEMTVPIVLFSCGYLDGITNEKYNGAKEGVKDISKIPYAPMFIHLYHYFVDAKKFMVKFKPLTPTIAYCLYRFVKVYLLARYLGIKKVDIETMQNSVYRYLSTDVGSYRYLELVDEVDVINLVADVWKICDTIHKKNVLFENIIGWYLQDVLENYDTTKALTEYFKADYDEMVLEQKKQTTSIHTAVSTDLIPLPMLNLLNPYCSFVEIIE